MHFKCTTHLTHLTHLLGYRYPGLGSAGEGGGYRTWPASDDPPAAGCRTVRAPGRGRRLGVRGSGPIIPTQHQEPSHRELQLIHPVVLKQLFCGLKGCVDRECGDCSPRREVLLPSKRTPHTVGVLLADGGLLKLDSERSLVE